MQRLGRIAFITTPKYRETHPDVIMEFVDRYLYPLCNSFEVLTTGRTYEFVTERLDRIPTASECIRIEEGTRFVLDSPEALDRWRTTIRAGMLRQMPGIQGMIEITHDLVEGRLDAVIHLTDWADVAGKPDSMVLRREANVHDVPIASDIHSARSVIATWMQRLARRPEGPIFVKRTPPPELPLTGLKPGDRVLGLIAHDGMKLEMCRFVVENARVIFNEFDYILATGTTGTWLRKFVLAAGRTERDAQAIRCCLSGPHGGDVQIAAAVVKKICRKVIFLQDPFASHAHETDIRLFEQAVLLFERAVLKEDVEAELATNVESARAILGV